MPRLIVHGDDDQIMPIGAAAMQSVTLVPKATLEIYPGGSPPSAIAKSSSMRDLLAFVKA